MGPPTRKGWGRNRLGEQGESGRLVDAHLEKSRRHLDARSRPQRWELIRETSAKRIWKAKRLAKITEGASVGREARGARHSPQVLGRSGRTPCTSDRRPSLEAAANCLGHSDATLTPRQLKAP